MGPSRRIPAAPLAGFPVGADLSPAERSLETPSGENSREIVKTSPPVGLYRAETGLRTVRDGVLAIQGREQMARVRLGAGEIAGNALAGSSLRRSSIPLWRDLWLVCVSSHPGGSGGLAPPL